MKKKPSRKRHSRIDARDGTDKRSTVGCTMRVRDRLWAIANARRPRRSLAKELEFLVYEEAERMGVDLVR